MAEAIVADARASGIYQIRNIVNGKRYVGSAVNLRARWRQHQCELRKGRHNPHLQSSWRKHGAGAFVFEIIERIDDVNTLIEREQHFIDTLHPEFNIAPVAGSNLGVKWDEQAIARMREANKSVWQREGHREKMSLAHSGQVFTKEHRSKLSAKKKGKKLSPEHAAKVAANNAERNRSEAHRKLMSAYWKGRPKTVEQIAKMAASKRGRPAHNRGKPATAQQRATQSEVMKRKYQEDPTLRDRVSSATRAAMSRPEVRAKISEGRRNGAD
jgi:group I intron endonuclease